MALDVHESPSTDICLIVLYRRSAALANESVCHADFRSVPIPVFTKHGGSAGHVAASQPDVVDSSCRYPAEMRKRITSPVFVWLAVVVSICLNRPAA